MQQIMTVGHSNHEWLTFLSLIKGAGVQTLVDVRSKPWSRQPHFRQKELAKRLEAFGISYVFLGDKLGGLTDDRVTDYRKMEKASGFLAGIEQLLNIAGQAIPALMCSEHDPLTCHRFLLISRHLASKRGVNPSHILRDGTIETQTETEDRLMAKWGKEQDLLQFRSERLNAAYRLQAKKQGIIA